VADRPAGFFLVIDIRKRLSAVVAHDKARGLFLGRPRRPETATLAELCASSETCLHDDQVDAATAGFRALMSGRPLVVA
jgi:hypothetical protein